MQYTPGIYDKTFSIKFPINKPILFFLKPHFKTKRILYSGMVSLYYQFIVYLFIYVIELFFDGVTPACVLLLILVKYY